MLSKLIFFISSLICTFAQTPTDDVLAVLHLKDFGNFLDGPSEISHAKTSITSNSKPTLDQMMYYNYYAVSMYCQYQLNDLSCDYCKKFKGDVNNFTILMNNDTDTTAMVAISRAREEIVVVYRGTMNIWNIVLDFDALAINYPHIPSGIKIHQGFHTATMSLYKDVVTNVGRFLHKYPNYKVVIVGHSLGAAIARLTQFFFITLDQFPGTKYELFTYGEPRSGNKALADYMNMQNITSARVVHSADIVAHVAPTSLLGTILGDHYVHCQNEYWLKADEENFCDNEFYEDPTCSDSLGPMYSIVDHGVYFDLEYTTCIAGQPGPWAAIPDSILQPVGTIPPLPQKISHFLGAVADSIVDFIEGIKGEGKWFNG